MDSIYNNRIKNVCSMFVQHNYVTEVYSKLDKLRVRRNNVSDPSEIHHAFIIGSSGSGKTTLAKNYCDKHQRIPGLEHDIVPVVRLEMPDPNTAGSFYDSVLDALGAVPVKRQTIDEKKRRAVHTLKGLGTEILIIDEFQNVFSNNKGEQMMGVVKHLANISNVVLVCVGLSDINDLRGNNQYKRRFKPIILPMR